MQLRQPIHLQPEWLPTPRGGRRRRLQIRDELVPGVEQFLLVDDVGTAEDGASLVAGEEQGEPPRVREVLLFLAARGLRSAPTTNRPRTSPQRS